MKVLMEMDAYACTYALLKKHLNETQLQCIEWILCFVYTKNS